MDRRGLRRMAPFDGPLPPIGRCWTAEGGRDGAGKAGVRQYGWYKAREVQGRGGLIEELRSFLEGEGLELARKGEEVRYVERRQ